MSSVSNASKRSWRRASASAEPFSALAFPLYSIRISQKRRGSSGAICWSDTDQIRRSSRSVAANIAEGYRKRRYPAVFVRSLINADGEATETQVWLDFARDSGYLSSESHKVFIAGYEELGRMLGSMIAAPERLAPF